MIRLELRVRASKDNDIRSETKKSAEKIEEFLQGFPGTLIKRTGADLSNVSCEVDIDRAFAQAATGKTHVQSNDGLHAISLTSIIPEEFDEKQTFVKQTSFRQGTVPSLPFAWEGSQHHFFLSHFQDEFGDACANVQSLLTKRGIQT